MKRVKRKNAALRVLVVIGVAVGIGAWCPEAEALPHAGFPDPGLPPVHPNPDIAYYGKDLHAMYPQGVIVSDPKHWGFTNVVRTQVGRDEQETFLSVLDASVDVPGMGIFGMPVRLTGPVTTIVRDYAHGQEGSFATEIVSMNLTGDIGGMRVVIRESPSRSSLGQTTITDMNLGRGEWEIDSFFDVFTELSVDGGPFMQDLNAPGRMELCPEPASMGLVGLGGCLMLLRRRRRR